MTLSIKKCSFAQQQVKYLGHIIGSRKDRLDPDRLHAVKKIKVPATKKQLRQMMGLFGYYRSYVMNFAMIAKPLADMTAAHKPMTLSWGENEQFAFDDL